MISCPVTAWLRLPIGVRTSRGSASLQRRIPSASSLLSTKPFRLLSSVLNCFISSSSTTAPSRTILPQREFQLRAARPRMLSENMYPFLVSAFWREGEHVFHLHVRMKFRNCASLTAQLLPSCRPSTTSGLEMS